MPRKRAASELADDEKEKKFDWPKEIIKELFDAAVVLKDDGKITEAYGFKKTDVEDIRAALNKEHRVWRAYTAHLSHISGWSGPVDGVPRSSKEVEDKHYNANPRCRRFRKNLPLCARQCEYLYSDNLATGNEAFEPDELGGDTPVPKEDWPLSNDSGGDAEGDNDVEEVASRSVKRLKGGGGSASSPAPTTLLASKRIHRKKEPPSDNVDSESQASVTSAAAMALKRVVDSYGITRTRAPQAPQSVLTQSILKCHKSAAFKKLKDEDRFLFIKKILPLDKNAETVKVKQEKEAMLPPPPVVQRTPAPLNPPLPHDYQPPHYYQLPSISEGYGQQQPYSSQVDYWHQQSQSQSQY
ncbi:uncharacterized protein MYCGRDRAFT_88598 [Zymoseptoria tritici IPO323]|uniref:Uncharacterized protein n=1 Tax=Zymoseptoria tritici (strain CBS 115943 / IPO323) TaxID=336722 RepID=F9WXC6_ZYMTI|nr:uncharacterized protein MYCGRDRAFT_88598 [Zymoseptoria tritici IPO323]EGP92780.1 hypothetical protein MYCGRDRAFT_88598 [Zymoseptoria tritici IPO323]